ERELVLDDIILHTLPLPRRCAGMSSSTRSETSVSRSVMSTVNRTSMLVACLLVAPAAFAGTRYVNVGLSTGANNGTSWADAYRGADGLATALAAATGG